MFIADVSAPQSQGTSTQPRKMESIPSRSFQSTLRRETQRHQHTPAQSANNTAGRSHADTRPRTAHEDTAGENLPTEELTAGALANPVTQQEGEASTGANESGQTLLSGGKPDVIVTGEVMETVETSSPGQAVSSGWRTPGQGNGQFSAEYAFQPQTAAVASTDNQPSIATTPVTTGYSMGLKMGSAEVLTSDQLSQTPAGMTNTDSAASGSSPTDKVPNWLSSVVISRTGEVDNPEETQVKTDSQGRQTARELAELESRRLTGQKAHVLQPSSAAEHNQVGRESRRDYSYQAVRPEGMTIKSPELNSLVTDKTAGLDSNLDTQDVLNQIVRKAELMVKSNNSQMKIELHPEFLGKLTIKVMVEEGAVTARFITDNHQVKQLLEANLAMLRQTLESQGMRVERAEVDVQLNNGGMFDGSQGQREWNWGNRYLHYQAGSGLADQDDYQIDREMLPAESVPYEVYGIDSDGSMNFVV